MSYLLAHPNEAPAGGFYLPANFSSGGYTDDEGDVEIHIDFVTYHYKFMQTLIDDFVKIDEQE